MGRVEDRKANHIRVCLTRDVESGAWTGFDDVYLVHRALPEIDLEDVGLGVEFLGHRFRIPLIISAMTGGTSEALKINSVLAEACQQMGVGMGVGSQRAAIEDRSLERTFRVVRERAPDAFIIANLGCPQLASGYGISEVVRAVEMVEADAIAIHMNPLQEAVQVGGEARYRGVLDRIREITSECPVPVIAKETGCGVSMETARMLEEAGVSCIDVAGAGGTSWAAVESYIAEEAGDLVKAEVGRAFRAWGVPTVVSLLEVRSSVGIPVIASGGVRSGLDAAKALSLGADMVGVALPLLKAAVEGVDRVKEYIRVFAEELRTAMFLTGSKSVEDLRRTPVIVLGRTLEWLRLRGVDVEPLARRRVG
mgnify:CR=1 FL=1